MNRYSVYAQDIKPLGFRMIEIDDFVSGDTVCHAHRYLTDKALRAETTEHNYRIASKYYSYEILEERLRRILSTF